MDTSSLDLSSVKDTLVLIGGKWRGQILASLCNDQKRFAEIKADIKNISSKTLIREIRFLESNNLITSEKIDQTKIYGLTFLGKSLEPILKKIEIWTAEHKNGSKHQKIWFKELK